MPLALRPRCPGERDLIRAACVRAGSIGQVPVIGAVTVSAGAMHLQEMQKVMTSS
jgi:hypothetical protein